MGAIRCLSVLGWLAARSTRPRGNSTGLPGQLGQLGQALGCVVAVEQPHRLVEHAAQRHQLGSCGAFGLAVVERIGLAVALGQHDVHARAGLADQRQVLSRALRSRSVTVMPWRCSCSTSRSPNWRCCPPVCGPLPRAGRGQPRLGRCRAVRAAATATGAGAGPHRHRGRLAPPPAPARTGQRAPILTSPNSVLMPRGCARQYWRGATTCAPSAAAACQGQCGS